MNRKAKHFILTILAALLIFGAAIWLTGSVLSYPAQRAVGAAPVALRAENVTFASASDANIHGWWITGGRGKGAIILMHGVRDSRLGMVERAKFLSAAGHSILLFDFQAHGESEGEQITFGYLENRDAQAAVKFVHEKLPQEKIGVIGVSLGGAATLLAEPKLTVDAIVLESVYPTIEQAIQNRFHHYLFFVGDAIAPLFVKQLQPRLGITPQALHPIEKIHALLMPKFIVAGSADKHTPLGESQQLFQAASEPKELWIVDGAGHEDLYRFAKQEYEQRVLKFFAASLTSR